MSRLSLVIYLRMTIVGLAIVLDQGTQVEDARKSIARVNRFSAEIRKEMVNG